MTRVTDSVDADPIERSAWLRVEDGFREVAEGRGLDREGRLRRARELVTRAEALAYAIERGRS